MGSSEQERPYVSTNYENIMQDRETKRRYRVRSGLALLAIRIRETIEALKESV
jgi:hypothetical protein